MASSLSVPSKDSLPETAELPEPVVKVSGTSTAHPIPSMAYGFSWKSACSTVGRLSASAASVLSDAALVSVFWAAFLAGYDFPQPVTASSNAAAAAIPPRQVFLCIIEMHSFLMSSVHQILSFYHKCDKNRIPYFLEKVKFQRTECCILSRRH